MDGMSISSLVNFSMLKRKGWSPAVVVAGCWLVGWLVAWLVGWLVGCLVGWLVGWLLGWLVGCLVGWLVGWLLGCLVGWLVGWLVVGWLVGWLVGCLVGWLVGWLVVCCLLFVVCCLLFVVCCLLFVFFFCCCCCCWVFLATPPPKKKKKKTCLPKRDYFKMKWSIFQPLIFRWIFVSFHGNISIYSWYVWQISWQKYKFSWIRHGNALVVDGCWLVVVSCRPWSNPSLFQGDEPGGGGRIEIDYVDFQVAWPGGISLVVSQEQLFAGQLTEKCHGWSRCISYWNNPFLGEHVPVPKFNSEEKTLKNGENGRGSGFLLGILVTFQRVLLNFGRVVHTAGVFKGHSSHLNGWKWWFFHPTFLDASFHRGKMDSTPLWKLTHMDTPKYPKRWWALEKVAPTLNMAIFDIYVKFPGCIQGISK